MHAERYKFLALNRRGYYVQQVEIIGVEPQHNVLQKYLLEKHTEWVEKKNHAAMLPERFYFILLKTNTLMSKRVAFISTNHHFDIVAHAIQTLSKTQPGPWCLIQ